MNNPSLNIPLGDYEGHMALPTIGQAELLASEFGALLKSHAPDSVALIGCAGGNGFDKAAEGGVSRLVGIDLNPHYISSAQHRYARTISGLELHCADIQGDLPTVQPVELVYAALVFEYVDVAVALKNISRLCAPGGLLAVVLQLPKQGSDAVTASPFVSLKELSSIMKLVPPDEFRACAETLGFFWKSQKIVTLQSGKQFSFQLFGQS